MLYFSPLFNNILTDKSLYKQSHYKRILGIFQKDPGQGDIRPYIFNFIVNIFKFQRRISVVMSCPDGRFKEIVGPECGICRMTGIPRLPEIIDTSRFWPGAGLVSSSVPVVYPVNQAGIFSIKWNKNIRGLLHLLTASLRKRPYGILSR